MNNTTLGQREVQSMANIFDIANLVCVFWNCFYAIVFSITF